MNNRKTSRGIAGVLAALTIFQHLDNASVFAAENSDIRNDNIFPCGDYQITYDVTDTWDHYENVRLSIYNPTDEAIYHWAFMFDAGGYISDLWNGVVADSKDNIYVIENTDYNNVIQPHSVVQLGYIVQYEDEAPSPEEFDDCTETLSLTDDFSLEYESVESWQEGQNVYLTVTNTSDRTIFGWEVAFDSTLPICSVWNGQLQENENESDYVIHCEEHNSILAPDVSVTIGVLVNQVQDTAFALTANCLNGYGLSYSFEKEDPDPSAIMLSGFNQYNINILNWKYNQDAEYSVYRKAEDEEEYTILQTVKSDRYFMDENAEPNVTYSYYVSAPNGSDVNESNVLKLKTGTIPETIPEEMPDWLGEMMSLEEDCSMLQIGYASGDSKDYVSHDLTLPESCINGTTVEWESDLPLVIDNNGALTAPYGTVFVPVKMTATLTNGRFSKTRTFNVLVVPQTEVGEQEIMTEETLLSLNEDNPDFSVLYSSKWDLVREIEGICAASPIVNSESAIAAMRALQDILGITDFENEIRYEAYAPGSLLNSYRFRQYRNGIPVVGCELFLQVDRNTNKAVRVTSNYMTEIALDSMEPALSDAEAADAVQNAYSGNLIGTPDLQILYYNPDREDAAPVLVWKVEIENGEIDTAWVDAMTGKIVQKSEEKSDGDDVYSEYNTLLQDNVSINTHYTGSLWWKKYFLHDTVRNIHIKNASGLTGTEWAVDGAYDYTCSDNDWSDAQYDNAVGASAQLADIYDYFADSPRNWNGYDGSGTPRMYIGVDRTIPNAQSGSNKLSFRFDDSATNNTRSYVADIDTVAHEFTHSVTRSKFTQKFGSSMVGDGESGSIEEAISDIFGEFIDPEYDWMHGDKIRVDGTCGRNLVDPESGTNTNIKRPATYLTSPNFKTVVGNEHHNSTIISHAAYLMTQDNPDTGLDGIPKESLENIWFTAYDFYDSSSPCFYDCRSAVTKAASNLYGSNSEYVKKVKEAFDAVNVLDQEVSFIVLDAYDNQPVSVAILKLEYTYSNNTAKYPITVFHLTNINGVYRMKSMPYGLCTITASKSGYNDTKKTVSVTSELYNYTLYLDPKYDRSLTGRIVIADSDTNPTNNAPLSRARVTLEKLSGDGYLDSYSKKRSSNTDTDGNYTFVDIPAGRYSLLIQYAGYLDTQQELMITKSGTTTYNFVIELIPVEHSGKGYASGTITDAKTGAKVSGLTLNIYKNIRIGSTEPTSTPVCTLTTDGNGAYRTDALDAGYYTIYVVDNRSGVTSSKYLTSSFPIKILGNTVIANQNGTVSTTLDQNQLRIVLTWGDTPRDLDSHLYVRSYTGTVLGHTNYSDKTYRNSTGIVADLDLDDRSSFGPETTTIYHPVDAMYTFYVHDYTNRNNTANTMLSSSNATVTVYSGTSSIPIATFNVPTGMNGTIWKVFSYNNVTGEIQGYSTISNSYN